MAKKYDMLVKTGTYQSNGTEKGKYENIGTVMEGKDGKLYAFIKRTFNPAGVEVEAGRDSILVGFYEPRETGPAAGSPAANAAPEDEIPF